MKKISFTICHYGSDYLGWAIKSVYDHVDEVWVVYTDKPSHGQGTKLQNPDTRSKIKDSLYHFGDPDKKIKWKEGHWGNEGAHRITSRDIAKECGAGIIVVVDADEVWQEHGLKKSLELAEKTPKQMLKAKMIHFWRSFNWVCRDAMTPDRIIKLSGEGIGYLPNGESPILHFGYARKLDQIKYKMDIHGHKNEWRPEWWGKFKAWKPACGMKDVHPTCSNIWDPKPFDKSTLPSILKDHPYFNLKIIE